MKVFAISYVFILLALSACAPADRQPQEVRVVRASDVCRKTLGVDGMACVGCEVTIEEKLSKIDGMVSVKASHKKKQVVIEFDSSRTNLPAIEAQILDAGYKIIPR